MNEANCGGVTEGARLLREYLRRHGQSIPVFCEEHGLGRIQVQRAIKGERQKIWVDFAVKIARATSGFVPVEAWDGATKKAA